MSRSTRRIGVISLIVGAIALVAVLDGHRSSRNSVTDITNLDEPHSFQPTQSESPDSAGPDRGSTDVDRSRFQANETETHYPRLMTEPDLNWLREETTNDVLVTYSLMFEHLGLTKAEQNALTDFLVDVWMSETITAGYRPEPIEEEYRQAGIAAIVGNDKLAQLLNLERNRAEYREAGSIAMYLQTNEAPLTDVQRDQLLGILIQVRGRAQPVVSPNAQQGTVEAIESRMTTMDEYERLVLELTPSVLTSQQIELVFARYQAMSYQRARILELQKKTRANEDEEDDFPLVYPARN